MAESREGVSGGSLEPQVNIEAGSHEKMLRRRAWNKWQGGEPGARVEAECLERVERRRAFSEPQGREPGGSRKAESLGEPLRKGMAEAQGYLALSSPFVYRRCSGWRSVPE